MPTPSTPAWSRICCAAAAPVSPAGTCEPRWYVDLTRYCAHNIMMIAGETYTKYIGSKNMAVLTQPKLGHCWRFEPFGSAGFTGCQRSNDTMVARTRTGRTG